MKLKVKKEIRAINIAIKLCKTLVKIDEDMRGSIIDDVCDLNIENLETKLNALDATRNVL